MDHYKQEDPVGLPDGRTINFSFSMNLSKFLNMFLGLIPVTDPAVRVLHLRLET